MAKKIKQNLMDELPKKISLGLKPTIDMKLNRQNRSKPISSSAIKTKDQNQRTLLSVSLQPHLKSKHVVNLKNPHANIFAKSDRSAILQPANDPALSSVQYRTPKISGNRTRKISVDFINAKSVLGELSISRFFLFVLTPVQVLINHWPAAKLKPALEPANTTFSRLPTLADTGNEDDEIEDIFAPSQRVNFFRVDVPRDWHRRVIAFIIISFIFILPLQGFTYYQNLKDTKDRVLIATADAIDNLKQGGQSVLNFDLSDAQSQFGEARNKFISAEQEISDLNLLSSELIKLVPGQGKSLQAGTELLAAGEIISDTAMTLARGGQQIANGKNVKEYYDGLVSFQPILNNAIDQFEIAKAKIDSIDQGDLPASQQATFGNVQKYIPEIESGLKNLYIINNSILKLLGKDTWQRYLVIFENNNEIRATGGFMGSFAVLDVDQGEIKKLDIPGGGTYELQGLLSPRVLSPAPLQLLKPRWEFQDSNWWPDFPTSAKKIEWFYRNAGGPSVDGVVALTSTVMVRLLDIFGPIDMPEYGRAISSQNFVEETQKIVELEYDKTANRPKQFLADLAPKLIDRIFHAKNDELQRMVAVLTQSLNERQLMIYTNNQPTESLITDAGWAGQLRSTDGDYLSVVHTNLAGGKTDGVIYETIEHHPEIQADGSIINTVKLIRRHTGVAGQNIFTGVQNNSYVRFYVPLGSTLISAVGFRKPADSLFKKPDPDLQPDLDLASVEGQHQHDAQTGTDIYTENGKTVFGNWLQLKPGEVQESTISYRLPFTVAFQNQSTYFYSLLVQKQAGGQNTELQSYLKLNDSLKPIAEFPSTLSHDEHNIFYSAPLTTDQFYGVVLISN